MNFSEKFLKCRLTLAMMSMVKVKGKKFTNSQHKKINISAQSETTENLHFSHKYI